MATKKTVTVMGTSSSIAASGSYEAGPLDLSAGVGLAVTTKLTFNASATAGALMDVLSSVDNTNFDSIPFNETEVTLTAGGTVIVSTAISSSIKYLKVKIKNQDSAQTITDVTVSAVVTTL